MKQWRWSGTLDRIGSGVIVAETEEEAVKEAKRQLQTGVPDYDISLDEIDPDDEDWDPEQEEERNEL